MIYKTVSCKCSECKNMCKALPCLGTPEDIERLIDAGYKDRLHKEHVPIFGEGDVVTERIPIIVTKTTTGQFFGPCPFQTSDGLCELHDKGLKPTEGKITIHGKRDFKAARKKKLYVVKTWKSEAGKRVFSNF